MVARQFFIFGLFTILWVPVAVADGNGPHEASLMVGAFSQGTPGDKLPGGWEELTFSRIKRHTQYQLVQEDEGVCVEARSRASASGIIRNLKFDARQYPWIAWRWKIENVLKNGDLRTKDGDDYAARLYVAFEFEPQNATWWERLTHSIASQAAGRPLPGTMLTYIWANQAKAGEVADNPYTDQVKMVVLQSGNTRAGQWVNQRRNLVDDYVRAFGREPPNAMGVAIMTDTDGTGETTSAFYGDISLSGGG